MAIPKTRILVVDDEIAIRGVLERILQREGFQVIQAASGAEALQKVADDRPNLIILDLKLPDFNGEEICYRVRSDPQSQSIPILVLTGQTTNGLPAECLNGGADDYIHKPFDIKEMVARIKAILRRPRLYAADDSVISRGSVSIHVGERRVLVKGKSAGKFAPKEFELLKQLILHAPNVIGKNALALSAWGELSKDLHHRTLDVHIRRIRQKLGPAAARCLVTISSVGYQWVAAQSGGFH